MNSAQSLVVLAVVLALGAGQSFAAAQKKEEDSAYQWGRWSVLSPAAGSPQYASVNTPGADFNARPGDAQEYQPEVLSVGLPPVNPPIDPPVEPPINPPVAAFCAAGTTCGFATYTRQDGGSEGSNGPVLADFAVATRQINDPNNSDPGGTPFDVTEFSVSGAEDSGSFPDVDSVQILGGFSGGSDDIQTTVGEVISFDESTFEATSTVDTSTLSHNNQDTGEPLNFDGVDSGYWAQLAQLRVANLLTNEGETQTLSDSNGYFVQGLTATLEQMESFKAGRVTAVYNGLVLDYNSPVALSFNFDNNTFNGNFTTANGFSGFQIDGAVSGVNFGASDAGKTVNGSFFNGGLNASGAVNNGSQPGVFSTDLAN